MELAIEALVSALVVVVLMTSARHLGLMCLLPLVGSPAAALVAVLAGVLVRLRQCRAWPVPAGLPRAESRPLPGARPATEEP